MAARTQVSTESARNLLSKREWAQSRWNFQMGRGLCGKVASTPLTKRAKLLNRSEGWSLYSSELSLKSRTDRCFQRCRHRRETDALWKPRFWSGGMRGCGWAHRLVNYWFGLLLLLRWFLFHLFGKTQVPHRIDETLDESLYRGGNPHLTSRFCKDELGPKFQHGIRACRTQGPPTYSRTKPKECWREGGVLGKTQVPHWIDETLDARLYRGGNPHLTSRFCKDELGPKFQHHPLFFVVSTLPPLFLHRPSLTPLSSYLTFGCIKSRVFIIIIL